MDTRDPRATGPGEETSPRQDPGLGKDPDLRRELDATVRARAELGDEYDSALADSFLERVERRIDDAVDRRVRRQLAERQLADARAARRPGTAGSWAERYGFALITLVLAIPLSAIAGGMAGLSGLVVAWLGIIGVNAAQSVRLNREPPPGRDRPAPGD
ncbi:MULTISPECIES: hypothetical protein [Streptomyces]|uniref:Integral membrane protein n=1 Tax=Streptomyces eurythermus TaxID=42237 RepID=A0ABW6YUN8_9ACTN|nr:MULTISPECIES: hypothetical protein [Streptomyces]